MGLVEALLDLLLQDKEALEVGAAHQSQDIDDFVELGVLESEFEDLEV